MATESCKNLIIGSGEAGKVGAWTLASAGQPTVVIERRWIGGSCPNVNCLPSKNEVWSAKVVDLVHHSDKFGISTPPSPVDMSAVRRRKREMVEGLIAMHLEKYKASGAQLIMGEAKFIGPRTVEVRLNDGGTRTFTGERIFLNLGSRASIPPVPGLAESSPLTNIELLEIDRLPGHLIVIGGGYVGLEFAQAYRRFGSKVTILQKANQLLADQDPDVAAEITQILASEGIDIVTSANILGVKGRSGSDVSVCFRVNGQEKTVVGTDILVATGRVPNTFGIALDVAGVELEQNGYIKVNDRLETTAPNIWALGDCAGSPQYTHISLDDFRVVRANLMGGHRSTRGRLIPSCLFTDPQVAHVGLTETEAHQQGLSVWVVRLPMISVLRTRTTGETRGFMKALIHPKDERILGFTMIGPEAGEVMAVVETAMLGNLPYTALRDAILTHPTMAEGLNGLFSAAKPAHATA